MTAADTIRHALDRVAALRSQAAGDVRLQQGLKAVKRLQAQRFSGTYGDLLATKAQRTSPSPPPPPKSKYVSLPGPEVTTQKSSLLASGIRPIFDTN